MAGTVNRRQLLSGAAIALPVIWSGSLLSGCGRSGGGPAEASAGFYDRIADIVIPPTSTPGGLAVKAGDFMDRAFRHTLFGAKPGDGAALEAALNNMVPGKSFMKAPPAAQIKAVGDLDAATFTRKSAPVVTVSQVGESSAGKLAAPAEPEPNRLWRMAKNALIVGYYFSEAGASRELRYELVPGRFDPDIPFKPGDTYLSNNWQANVG